MVVFPAPFGPSTPKTSPCSTVNEMPRTASSSPYDLRRSVTSIAYWSTAVDYANLPLLPFACVDIGSNTTRLLVAEVRRALRELAAVGSSR